MPVYIYMCVRTYLHLYAYMLRLLTADQCVAPVAPHSEEWLVEMDEQQAVDLIQLRMMMVTLLLLLE